MSDWESLPAILDIGLAAENHLVGSRHSTNARPEASTEPSTRRSLADAKCSVADNRRPPIACRFECRSVAYSGLGTDVWPIEAERSFGVNSTLAVQVLPPSGHQKDHLMDQSAAVQFCLADTLTDQILGIVSDESKYSDFP